MNIHNPKDLITIDRATAFEIFTTDDPETAFAPILADLRTIVADWEGPGVETAEAREQIRKFHFKLTKARTAVEAIGKGLATEAKALPKKIDASRRYIEDEIDAIQAEIRAPLTAWEKAEEARKVRHTKALSDLASACAPIDRTADECRKMLAALKAFELVDAEEYIAEYEIAIDAARKFLTAALAKREKADDEAAELETLRREKAERERLDRDADIAAKAADEARKLERDAAAERERKLVADRDAADAAKEAATQAAINAAAKAKADLERQAHAAAEAQRERENNTRHRGTINRKALASLVENGIDEKTAKKVIELIARGLVHEISIRY